MRSGSEPKLLSSLRTIMLPGEEIRWLPAVATEREGRHEVGQIVAKGIADLWTAHEADAIVCSVPEWIAISCAARLRVGGEQDPRACSVHHQMSIR